MLTYEQARRTVIDQAEKAKGPRATATLSVWDALGFVLAEEIKTDRDYPPFNRSTRDGYAVRAAEVAPGTLVTIIGMNLADGVATAAPNATARSLPRKSPGDPACDGDLRGSFEPGRDSITSMNASPEVAPCLGG